MNKKLLIIPIIVLVLLVMAIIYKTYNIDIKLTESKIEVNLYDKVNLEQFFIEAIDSRGKNLNKDIKISVDCDEEDILQDNSLFIKGNGIKTVNYYINWLGKKFSSKLIINVITDPFNEKFNINYENIDDIDINEEDTGFDINEKSDLSQEQKNYINLIINS